MDKFYFVTWISLLMLILFENCESSTPAVPTTRSPKDKLKIAFDNVYKSCESGSFCVALNPPEIENEAHRCTHASYKNCHVILLIYDLNEQISINLHATFPRRSLYGNWVAFGVSGRKSMKTPYIFACACEPGGLRKFSF